MNRKPVKNLAAARAAQTATEKALLLAEVAAKRSQTAKVDFKLAKRTWKLARKAAKRTAKEARRRQKQLAKFAGVLKKAKSSTANKSVHLEAPRPPRKRVTRRAAPKAAPLDSAIPHANPPESTD